MFFEKEMISFHILDVISLKQTNVDALNSGRNYSALSFRYKAKTVFETKDSVHILDDSTITYVPAGLEYRRKSEEDELIVIHFDTIDYQTSSIEVFRPSQPDELGQLFKKALQKWNEKGSAYRYECAAILYEILGACYAQNYKPEIVPAAIQKSVAYLQAHYKQHDLTISKVASESYMSEVYFRRLFKMAFNITPQKYIIQLRIQNAVGLISTGYYSLAEVAQMSGYTDYKYFSVEFKKHMGVSPSDYSYNYHNKKKVVSKNKPS